MKTQVAIIGGGPAGMLLSQLLDLNGIDNIVLERRSKEYVLGRIRAGVLEQGTVDMLHRAGIGERVAKEGMVHLGIGIAVSGELHNIDIQSLTNGKVVTVFGQTEITHDLYQARDALGGIIVNNAEEVALHQVDSSDPYVTFTKSDQEYRVDCEFIAGCDGFHGVSRKSVPDQLLGEYHFTYPFCWLGILSETPPVSKEVVYASHPRGFALCSMRNNSLSRYYLQLEQGDSVENWSDDAFWSEFSSRIPAEMAADLETGSSVEKSIAPLRVFTAKTLHYGRLFLAGDAAHIVPPTGAKGLNLAVSDIHYLSTGLVEYYKKSNESLLLEYSSMALKRINNAVKFSQSCTELLHNFPGQSQREKQQQQSELDSLVSSKSTQTAFAENYVGLPY